MKTLLPLFAVLAACAPSEEKFETESIALTCEKTFECTAEEDITAAQEAGFWFFGADVDECITIFTEATEESTEDTAADETEYVYNKAAAKECLASMEAATCDDLSNAEFTPAGCDEVYTEE